MGTTIDSLEIEIETSAKTASNTLDRLSKKLDILANSVEKLETGKLQSISTGIKNISDAATGFKGGKSAELSSLANALKKFEGINTNSMYGISSAMQSLVNGMNGIGSLTFDASSLSALLNSVSKLGGKSATQAAKNLSPISAQLQNFVRELNNIGSLSFDITNLSNLISSISKLGGKNVTQAITNLPQLAKALKDLMQTLSTAPQVSKNVIQMVNSLSNIASQGSKAGTASNSLSASLNRYSASASKAAKNSKSLSERFRNLYTTSRMVLNTLRNAGEKLWGSIESSMDYIETLNYFNAAFGQVAGNADYSQFKGMGEEAAEAYYNSFSERAKELTSKMTGFSISEKGTLTATGLQSLGLNPTELMNYQAMFGQMSSSMGIASETSLKMSQALTEIGADLASVKNMDFDKVWTDMASGLAGMSRTLDKYGVNIRNVNLQQKLTELGIDANISALNQNDKALLRTIILLDSTEYAWGDLADRRELEKLPLVA